MESISATTARPLPRWAWILSFLFLPCGVFVAFGFARLLSWGRCLLLVIASLGSVLVLARIMSYLDETRASALMHAFGMSGFLALYTSWLFTLYWIGRRASYWSPAALRGWRWAGWLAIVMYGLNVISLLESIALSFLGGA